MENRLLEQAKTCLDERDLGTSYALIRLAEQLGRETITPLRQWNTHDADNLRHDSTALLPTFKLPERRSAGQLYGSPVGSRSNPTFQRRYGGYDDDRIATLLTRHDAVQKDRYIGVRRAPEPKRLKRWLGRLTFIGGAAAGAIATLATPVFG